MCHTQLAGRWPWSTGDRVDNTWPVAALAQAVKPDIGSGSRFLPTPPAFNAPVRGGFRRNIAMPFGAEKLECCGYPMVKIFEYSF